MKNVMEGWGGSEWNQSNAIKIETASYRCGFFVARK
jgi:hypothetical protein